MNMYDMINLFDDNEFEYIIDEIYDVEILDDIDRYEIIFIDDEIEYDDEIINHEYLTSTYDYDYEIELSIDNFINENELKKFIISMIMMNDDELDIKVDDYSIYLRNKESINLIKPY